MTVTVSRPGRSPRQRSGAWALLLGAVCAFTLPARAAPSETVSSPGDAPREVRLAALDPASVHVGLLSGASPQAVASDGSRRFSSGHVAGEVLAGLLGEFSLVVPGAVFGDWLGWKLADTSSCAAYGEPRRSDCREELIERGSAVGIALGLSVGTTLGSGLGVLLAGAIGQLGGNGWMALLGSAAGGLITVLGFQLLPPDLKVFALLAAFPIPLIGAIVLYESSIPSSATAPAATRSPVRITPSVAWVPGGGVVGLSGRF